MTETTSPSSVTSAFATPSSILSTPGAESISSTLESLSQSESLPDLEQDRGSVSPTSSDSIRGTGRMGIDEDDSSSIGSGSNSGGLRTPPNLHQNTTDPLAKWVVQKFGGTSVGKFATKIAEDVIPQYLDQHKVAIVCSARSGSTKALGTTNLLLKAASQVLDRGSRANRSGSISGTPGTQTPSWAGGNGAQTPSWAGSPRPFSSLPTTPGGPGGTNSPPPFFSSLNGSPSGSSGRGQQGFSETVDLIRKEHFTAARSLIKDKRILAELEGEIERDCEGLRAYLFAAQIIDEISPRSKDNIVGIGERLACKLITALLRDRGIDAEFVSMENIVPPCLDSAELGQGGESGQLGQAFYDRLAIALGERIRACGTKVPVITGFFGPVPGSLLAQIGRGYTDLLAALLSVGLNASELQIWKEVDGIFTADPRKVPTARLIPVISPDEAAELTYYGSEVVHPFVMEQVIRKKIPIRIKNVMNPGGGGTVIHPDPDVVDAAELGPELPSRPTPSNPSWSPTNVFAPIPTPSSPTRLTSSSSSTSLSSLSKFNALPHTSPRQRQHRSPTAVTIKDHIAVLNVNSNRKSVSHGFLAKIFGTLDRFGVVVDLISTSEVHVSMAIEMPTDDEGRGKRGVERLVRELKGSGTVSVHYDMAILSLVGKQMRNMVGIAGRMFTTLADGQVNIEMISQGASEINISCVIEGRDAVKALNLIHQACLSSAALPDNGGGRGIGPWLF